MLHGAQLAVEEANARGGYGGKPFKLMLHNDYDNWQAKTVYGEDRPTDPTIWGSASNEVVKMVYDDEDWAIFGSISSESTHIALARGTEGGDSYRQFGFDRSDDSGDLHSLVLYRSAGRPRAGPYAGSTHLYRTRPEAGGPVARQQSLRPLRRPQVSRCFAAARTSGRHRAEILAGRYGLYPGS